jgi:hypothetical protein
MHLLINVKFPNNISKWHMGFNSVFKGLMLCTGARIFVITGEEQGRTCEQRKSDLDVNVHLEEVDRHFQNFPSLILQARHLLATANRDFQNNVCL